MEPDPVQTGENIDQDQKARNGEGQGNRAGQVRQPVLNPTVRLAAMLLAGLDGIQNRIDPGDPLDKNLYELPPEELAKVPTVPDSLLGAIEALEKDHEFLLKGDVFTQDFLDNWSEMKRREYDALRVRPHPYEFYMYFDL